MPPATGSGRVTGTPADFISPHSPWDACREADQQRASRFLGCSDRKIQAGNNFSVNLILLVFRGLSVISSLSAWLLATERIFNRLIQNRSCSPFLWLCVVLLIKVLLLKTSIPASLEMDPWKKAAESTLGGFLGSPRSSPHF